MLIVIWGAGVASGMGLLRGIKFWSRCIDYWKKGKNNGWLEEDFSMTFVLYLQFVGIFGRISLCEYFSNIENLVKIFVIFLVSMFVFTCSYLFFFLYVFFQVSDFKLSGNICGIQENLKLKYVLSV